jgi:hypothetical protein
VDESTEREESTRQIIGLLIQGAREIRERLKLDEEYYVSVSPTASPYGRAYYLYGVLDQIERACFAHSRMDETAEKGLLSAPDSDIGRRLRRNLLHTVHAEGALWVRKLTEVLIELVHFTRTNEDPYYRHYLLKQVIEDYERANTDYGRYFSEASGNIAYMLDMFRTTATKVESQLDVARCWYLQATKRGRGPKLANFRELLDSALPDATKPEKLALGLSYQSAYSRPSKSIHWSIGPVEPRVDESSIATLQTQVLILAIHVVLRCRKLTGLRTRQGPTAQLAAAFRRNRLPAELYDRATARRVSKGDFVVVQDTLAEVVGVRRSPFGYKSYRVRFLERPPLPSITEDWYPAAQIRVLLRSQDLRADVRETLGDAGVQHVPSRLPAEAVRKSVIENWTAAGLKEHVLGDPEAAKARLAEYLRSRASTEAGKQDQAEPRAPRE